MSQFKFTIFKPRIVPGLPEYETGNGIAGKQHSVTGFKFYYVSQVFLFVSSVFRKTLSSKVLPFTVCTGATVNWGLPHSN
jgi:hypothetical protein